MFDPNNAKQVEEIIRMLVQHDRLKGVIHIEANLQGANLKGARLTGANLKDAGLEGADLEGADLTGADLTGARITPRQLSQIVILPE